MRRTALLLVLVLLAGCGSPAGSPTGNPTGSPTGTPAGPPGRLAYIHNGGLWVLDLPDGKPRRIVAAKTATRVRFSPDGQWLMLTGPDEVTVQRLDGSGAWRIPAGSAAWNPRASLLAFLGPDGSIWLNRADGSDEQVLVRPAPGESLGSIIWHPDGRSLAYTAAFSSAEAFTPGATAASLRQVALTTSPTPGADGPPTELHRLHAPERFCTKLLGWGPGQNSVLYFQFKECANSAYADGAELLSAPPPRSLGEMLTGEGFTARAPDGRLALVLGRNRETWTNKRLTVLDAVGKVLWRSQAGQAAAQPAWSHDSSALAYVAMPDAGPVGGGEPAHQALLQRRIHLVDGVTWQSRQVSSGESVRDEAPRWSWAGDYLLFVRMDAQNRVGIWSLRLGDGSVRRLVDLGERDWFGYYGNVDWWAVVDYWPGQ